MPGFTGEGLVIPRQPEIIQDLIEEEKINIQPWLILILMYSWGNLIM